MKITISVQIKPREIKEVKEMIATELQEKFDGDQIVKGIETLVNNLQQAVEETGAISSK